MDLIRILPGFQYKFFTGPCKILEDHCKILADQEIKTKIFKDVSKMSPNQDYKERLFITLQWLIYCLFFPITVTASGSCETVFRLTNGKGVYQWVRGKARTLYDKNDKPECITADNVLLK